MITENITMNDLSRPNVDREDSFLNDKKSIYMWNNFNTNLDVCCLPDILYFKERACNTHMCSDLRKRWEKHRLECPSANNSNNSDLKNIVLKPLLDTGVTPPVAEEKANNVENKLVWTSPDIMVTVSQSTDPRLKSNVFDKNVSSNIQSLSNTTQTSDILLLSNNYSNMSSLTKSEDVGNPSKKRKKEDIRNIILKWLTEVPIYPTFDVKTRKRREETINELIENVYTLSGDANNKHFERDVKSQIRNFLQHLQIWNPAPNNDQNSFIDSLITLAYDRIKKMVNLRCVSRMFNKRETQKPSDTINCNKYMDNSANLIEKEIFDWISNINLNTTDQFGNLVDKNHIKNICQTQLQSLIKLNVPLANAKLIIKTEIVAMLHELPVLVPSENMRNLIIYRHADNLANRLLGIVAMSNQYNKCRNTKNYRRTIPYQQHSNDTNSSIRFDNDNFKSELLNMLQSLPRIGNRTDIYEALTDILSAISNFSNYPKDLHVRESIFYLLHGRFEIPEMEALSLANLIVEKTKRLGQNVDKECSTTFGYSGDNSFIILTSDHSISGFQPSTGAVTSTPKKTKKDIPKLSDEEMSYMNKVAQLVRSWMETLPEQFNSAEDKNFKETIIYDLAGDIMDEVKLEQFAPHTEATKEKLIRFFLLRWIFKIYETYHDMNDKKKQEVIDRIDDFMRRLKEIPIPVMTRSHQGGRQAMANIKQSQRDSGFMKDYIPKGIDIIEDEISVWLNEQPSDIYLNIHKDERNKRIHEVAMKIEDKLKNKRPPQEIKSELAKWLTTVVKSKNIDQLSETLTEKMKRLPMDDTIATKYDRKIRMRKEDAIDSYVEPEKNAIKNLDKTLKEFVDKFIQQNYDEEDPLVKDAYGEILRSEFRKLNPPTRNQVYENYTPSRAHERLNKELQYIKDISDWLLNIQIDSQFNIPGNTERVDFVNSLAREICEIEMNRLNNSQTMDYNLFLESTITQRMHELPILPEARQYVPLMANQLTQKIISRRPPSPVGICCNNESIINDSIQEQNLNEFIDEYIRLNCKDIADDPVKLEAWTARVMNEIKKITDTSQPADFHKMQVYDKLDEITSEDQVKKFNDELKYAKEIGDWMKNMPLKPISDGNDRDYRVRMISDLAQKISESDNATDSNKIQDLNQFIEKWISQLPLQSNKELDVPILTQQLLRRVNRVVSEYSDENKTKEKNDFIYSCPYKTCTQRSVKKEHDSKVGGSGELIVDAIEKWTQKLPLHGNKDDIKNTKDNINRRLFQRVAELSADPRIDNDDLLYQDMLSDEVDIICEEFQIKNEKDALKMDLLGNIQAGRDVVKEKTAGDTYKQKLENTIDASIPTPITNRIPYDPGFEIYKNHIANMFILQNFDYGDDEVKLKYEMRIKDEIDKYFAEAKKRNAIPITKDEMFNEIYSSLFKVPVPNENSVAQEVEKVKIRYEIDEWFDGLPKREAIGLNEEYEWDQILTMLAKRINEIEHNESNPNEKIHKEVTKWLTKLPLRPGQEKKINKFAKDLEDQLKSTKNQRKCVIKPKDLNKVSRKGKSLKKATKKSNKGLENSQIPGPSKEGKMWSSFGQTSQVQLTPVKKSGDIIIDIVENWCNQLPLTAKSPQEIGEIKTIKDNLATKILIKISELNASRNIFDDELLYDECLDDGLEKIIITLPICCELQQCKEVRKYELKEAIKSIKPLIKEERVRYEYKQELKKTVVSMLEEPEDISADKSALFKELVNEIADSFVKYNYNRDNIEEKQTYRSKVYDAIIRYFSEINNKEGMDPLIKRNQLLCELAKIPIPSDKAIQDEIEELTMKDEVAEFLDSVIPDEKGDKSIKKKQVESYLAKRLTDIEKGGHTTANDQTMAEEIAKSIKKLDTEVKMDSIGAFVEKLKLNETERKTPPACKSDFESSVNISSQLKHHGWKSGQEDSILDTHKSRAEADMVPDEWYSLDVVPMPADMRAQISISPKNTSSRAQRASAAGQPEWISLSETNQDRPPREIFRQIPSSPESQRPQPTSHQQSYINATKRRPSQVTHQNYEHSQSRRDSLPKQQPISEIISSPQQMPRYETSSPSQLPMVAPSQSPSRRATPGMTSSPNQQQMVAPFTPPSSPYQQSRQTSGIMPCPNQQQGMAPCPATTTYQEFYGSRQAYGIMSGPNQHQMVPPCPLNSPCQQQRQVSGQVNSPIQQQIVSPNYQSSRNVSTGITSSPNQQHASYVPTTPYQQSRRASGVMPSPNPQQMGPGFRERSLSGAINRYPNMRRSLPGAMPLPEQTFRPNEHLSMPAEKINARPDLMTDRSIRERETASFNRSAGRRSIGEVRPFVRPVQSEPRNQQNMGRLSIPGPQISEPHSPSDLVNNRRNQLALGKVSEQERLTVPDALQNPPRKRTDSTEDDDLCECLHSRRPLCVPVLPECHPGLRPFHGMVRLPGFFYF